MTSARRPVRAPGRRRSGATARPRAAATDTTPRPRVTARAAVLVLVLVVLVMSFASSLRAYVDQRRHLGDLREAIATSQQQIDALEREQQRWGDRAYVISQARARFAFGFPGEIGYQVLDEDGRPLDHVDSLSQERPLEDPDPEWWQTTVTSLGTAGDPPAAPRVPAVEIAPDSQP